jgi:hypothetical protein
MGDQQPDRVIRDILVDEGGMGQGDVARCQRRKVDPVLVSLTKRPLHCLRRSENGR